MFRRNIKEGPMKFVITILFISFTVIGSQESLADQYVAQKGNYPKCVDNKCTNCDSNGQWDKRDPQCVQDLGFENTPGLIPIESKP